MHIKQTIQNAHQAANSECTSSSQFRTPNQITNLKCTSSSQFRMHIKQPIQNAESKCD